MNYTYKTYIRIIFVFGTILFLTQSSKAQFSSNKTDYNRHYFEFHYGASSTYYTSFPSERKFGNGHSAGIAYRWRVKNSNFSFSPKLGFSKFEIEFMGLTDDFLTLEYYHFDLSLQYEIFGVDNFSISPNIDFSYASMKSFIGEKNSFSKTVFNEHIYYPNFGVTLKLLERISFQLNYSFIYTNASVSKQFRRKFYYLKNTDFHCYSLNLLLTYPLKAREKKEKRKRINRHLIP